MVLLTKADFANLSLLQPSYRKSRSYSFLTTA